MVTTQPGDPTFPVDRIRGALLCTPEHRQLYLENARFHHDIDFLAAWLPMWIDVMATETRRAAEVDKLVAARLAEARPPLETFEVRDGTGKFIKTVQVHQDVPASGDAPKSLAELMADVETSMAEAKEARDRQQQPPESMHRVELGELHNYQPPLDDPAGPCTFEGCGLPGIPGTGVVHVTKPGEPSLLPRQEWMEPHDYVPPDGDVAPCCHLPPEDDLHTMPTDPGDWHDHNVGVVPDDEPI